MGKSSMISSGSSSRGSQPWVENQWESISVCQVLLTALDMCPSSPGPDNDDVAASSLLVFCTPSPSLLLVFPSFSFLLYTTVVVTGTVVYRPVNLWTVNETVNERKRIPQSFFFSFSFFFLVLDLL